jgi:RimJ/RimL family protein N-acetyltransferase
LEETALLILETERLILRRWRNEDLEAAAAINADPEVMAWIGAGPMTLSDSVNYLTRNDAYFDSHGFGIWAVERKEDRAMIGFSGLRRFERPRHPIGSCIEAAWRFAREVWGQGYATEAARAAFLDGFNRCGIATITSWAPIGNLRSQALMRRIGMKRRPERDFEAPALPVGHKLRPHVVFTADRATWPEPVTD